MNGFCALAFAFIAGFGSLSMVDAFMAGRNALGFELLVLSGFALVGAVLCLIDYGWEAYRRGLDQGRKDGGA